MTDIARRKDDEEPRGLAHTPPEYGTDDEPVLGRGLEVIEIDEDDWNTPLPDLAELPSALYYRILIMPFRPRKRRASGLITPDTVQRNSIHLNNIGRLVVVGASAFRSPRLWPGVRSEDDIDRMVAEHAPKRGDWVMWGRYVGFPFIYSRYQLVAMPEDALLCVLDPRLLKLYT